MSNGHVKVKLKSKAILVTDHEGVQVCDMSRISHFLDNQLKDVDEVFSHTRRPLLTP
jgi:hypothetical protein